MLSAAVAESSIDATPTRPTSGAADGSTAVPRAAGHVMATSRVLRVQLDWLTDPQWTALRALAREAAQFCNALLADFYAQKLGYRLPADGLSAFRRWAGTLSGDVRVALQREAFTAWRKHGGKIVSGAQRLALFSADRVLVCRAEHMSKGRRQRHAFVTQDGADSLSLVVRLTGAAHGGRHTFGLAIDPRADDYVRPVLEGLASGDVRLLKVTFQFERPGRKVFALLTYEKHVAVPAAGQGVATLGPLEADGSLWLRWEEGGRPRSINYTQWVSTLAAKKEHFAGIHKRLRARLRRSGPGHRQAYRRELVEAGSFGAWCQGRLHVWSAEIRTALQRYGIGRLSIGPLEHQELPMAALIAMLTYKLAEAGIALERFDVAEPSTERAVVRPLAKQRRGIVAQRTALNVLKERVAAVGG